MVLTVPRITVITVFGRFLTVLTVTRRTGGTEPLEPVRFHLRFLKKKHRIEPLSVNGSRFRFFIIWLGTEPVPALEFFKIVSLEFEKDFRDRVMFKYPRDYALLL